MRHLVGAGITLSSPAPFHDGGNMKIIIESDKDKVINVAFENADDGQACYENVTAIIFCVLESFTKQVKDALGNNQEEVDALWDYVAGACDQLCLRCFPESPDDSFVLSDAALIYAEDQIIKRAEKKGISFEDALRQYEEKARKYVAEKSGVLKS